MELEKLNKKILSEAIKDLAGQVIMWQKQYNEAALRIEKLTEKRQLKVITISREELIEEAVNRYDNNKITDL